MKKEKKKEKNSTSPSPFAFRVGAVVLLLVASAAIVFAAMRMFREQPLRLLASDGVQYVVQITPSAEERDGLKSYITHTPLLESGSQLQASALAFQKQVEDVLLSLRSPAFIVGYKEGAIALLPLKTPTLPASLTSIAQLGKVLPCGPYTCILSTPTLEKKLLLSEEQGRLSQTIDETKFGRGVLGFQTFSGFTLQESVASMPAYPYKDLVGDAVQRVSQGMFGSISFEKGMFRTRMTSMIGKDIASLIDGNAFMQESMSQFLATPASFRGFITIPRKESRFLELFTVRLLGQDIASLLRATLYAESSRFFPPHLLERMWNFVQERGIGMKTFPDGSVAVALEIPDAQREDLQKLVQELFLGQTMRTEKVRLPDRSYGMISLLDPDRLRMTTGTGTIFATIHMDDAPVLYMGKIGGLTVLTSSGGVLEQPLHASTGELLHEFQDGKEYAFSISLPTKDASHFSFGWNIFDDRIVWEFVLP